MQRARRSFLKTTGLWCVAAMLPSWRLELEAAQAAALDKDKLADLAITTAKRLSSSYADIRINRYRNELIATREHS
jgi:hypothetical protein